MHTVKQKRGGKRFWCGCRRILFRILVCLLLIGTVVVAYLHYVGIPRVIKTWWIEALEEQEHYASVGRITFNVFEGALAHDFAYFDHSARVKPLLEAGTVFLDIDVREWFRKRPGLRGLSIVDGTARLSTMHPLHEIPPNQVLVIRDLDATLLLKEDKIEIQALQAKVLEMNVEGGGDILWKEAMRRDRNRRIIPSGSGVSRYFQSQESQRIPELLEELNDIKFETPPNINLTFLLHPASLESCEFRLSCQGGETTIHGVTFDAWQLAAAYMEERLKVHALKLSAGGRDLTGGGEVDFAARTFEARLDSNLPPTHWISLLPVGWRDQLADLGLHLGGAFHAALDVGRAPLNAFWRNLSGSVKMEAVTYKGISVREGSLNFVCEEPWIHIKDAQFEIGPEEDAGSVEGSLSWNFSDHTYAASMKTHVDYLLIAPVLPAGQVRLARHLQFTDSPLKIRMDMKGKKGFPKKFSMEGYVQGTNFYYKGTYANYFSSPLSLTNRLLTMNPIHGSRDEGDMDGTIRIDYEDKRIDLDLVSSADPKAAARVGHKVVEQILAPFTFNGPTRTEVVGSVFVGTNGVSEVRVSSVAERMSVYSFETDELSFEVVWSNQSVNISNIEGRLYGGDVSGYYNVYPDEERPEDRRYAFDLEAKGVNFEDAIRTFLHREGDPYQGFMDLRLQLSGLMGANRGQPAAGSGSIAVREGRILQIPVFGGLSKMLAKIYPGLGFTRQTELKADFDVEGHTLRSEKVTVEGNVFTIVGEGNYGLVSKDLDFEVEFKLLGDGAVGAVVQFVTTPITKLLKFDLEGTISDPRWRPKNLPKELFIDSER